MADTQSIGSEPFGMSLFLPSYDFDATVPFAASVITAAPTSAEFYVTCGPEAEDCGLGPGATVTMQPGTYGFGIKYPGFTMSERCEIEHQTAACTKMVDGEEANDPGTASETMTDVTTADYFQYVTITAGFEALAGVSGPAAGPTTAQSGSGGADSEITSAPTATPASGSSDAPAAAATETGPSVAAAPRAASTTVVAVALAFMGCAAALVL